MKIIDIITGEKPSLSFEVFPPKTSDKFETVKAAVDEIALLDPSFMSVTYGAGGGTSDFTVKIAEDIKIKNVTPLAHLSCITSTKERVKEQLEQLKGSGIENILALRGDIPENFGIEKLAYHYASDLVGEIKAFGGFCIGGACYPETHPDASSAADDILHLREKADAGCEFFTTQMFFDNNVFYNFMYRIREAGINVPVIAGIMPVTNAKSIRRICAMNNTFLPQKFSRIVDFFGSDPAKMKEAGIAYATNQIVDLFANGVNAVHVYSMNKPDVAKEIYENVSSIIS